MRARVQKWGNGLGIRIPKALALEAHLGEHATVEMTLVDGKLLLSPVSDPAPTAGPHPAARLVQAWLHGDEDEQRQTLQFLKQALDEDRLSDRPRFGA